MANLPLRGLGQLGALPDAKPYDLPANAFSKAVNVLFDEGGVQRGPVFKQLFATLTSGVSIDTYGGSYDSASTAIDSSPAGAGPTQGSPVLQSSDARFVGTYADPAVGETLIVADHTGRVRGYPNGVQTDLTPVVIQTLESPWTHSQVAGLSFLAREGMTPVARRIASSAPYVPLGESWEQGTTAAVVRAYNDFVIALNVTKGTDKYPTMVKWSDPVAFGTEPGDINWAADDTTGSAGENTIGEMTSPLRDGVTLGSAMILYTADQVWLMEYNGSSLVFSFRRLFASGGIINVNCAVEVDGSHFVFGDDDIYVHDGLTKKSLADERVRKTIFKGLDRTKRTRCFVQHDPVASLVYFAYPSKDADVGFPGTAYANRAAVYNYRNDTWTFVDLPNIVGGGSINLSASATDVVRGGLESPRVTVMLGVTAGAAGLSASRIYAVEVPAQASIPLTPHPETVKSSYVERTGLDLDDPSLGLPLRSYKTVNALVPLMDAPLGATWTVGAADTPVAEPVWYFATLFDQTRDYKIDLKVSGRFLAYRVTFPGSGDFKFSGFDCDVKSISRR